MRLARALRISTVPRLGFVGAGGKTTALFQLARELPPPVLVTSTTHFAMWQLRLADQQYSLSDPQEVANLDVATRGAGRPIGYSLLHLFVCWSRKRLKKGYLK